MMKKLLIIVAALFIFTGCENKVNEPAPNAPQLNHKVYKYMKISTDNTSGLINIAYIFGDPGVVGYLDDEYKPTLIVEFDTVTGRPISVKYYAFFLDYVPETEWVDKAIEKFNTTSSDYKKDFSNVSKGRVNDNLTYLEVSINPKSYTFNQYVQILFEEQDIEHYKNVIYYDRLYNYSTTPEVKIGDNYFEESLEHIRIEWSDNMIKAY